MHAITEKGRGHKPATDDEAEKFHAVGVVDPETGVPLAKGGKSWTSVFSDELVKIGSEILGGKGGGGRKDFAQAGGTNGDNIEEVFKVIAKKIN